MQVQDPLQITDLDLSILYEYLDLLSDFSHQYFLKSRKCHLLLLYTSAVGSGLLP
jgi:hypothetical protein